MLQIWCSKATRTCMSSQTLCTRRPLASGCGDSCPASLVPLRAQRSESVSDCHALLAPFITSWFKYTRRSSQSCIPSIRGFKQTHCTKCTKNSSKIVHSNPLSYFPQFVRFGYPHFLSTCQQPILQGFCGFTRTYPHYPQDNIRFQGISYVCQGKTCVLWNPPNRILYCKKYQKTIDNIRQHFSCLNIHRQRFLRFSDNSVHFLSNSIMCDNFSKIFIIFLNITCKLNSFLL